MVRRLPPLNPLRAVEATARHGSVADAARELHVTPGAVSHQIRAFEAHLGAPVFERGGGRLRPTGRAAAFLAEVSAAFERIAAARAGFDLPSTAGDLRVACVPALLQFWLIPRLPRFFAAYPEVRLSVFPSNDPGEVFGRGPGRGGAGRAAAAEPADLHLFYGDGDVAGAHVALWAELELFPVISPAALNAAPLRSVRDLGGHAILHADEGREWRIWRAALGGAEAGSAQGEAPGDAPREAPWEAPGEASGEAPGPGSAGALREHYFSDASVAIQAAVHGAGVALGDSFTTADFLRRGLLAAPFDRASAAAGAFYFVRPAERRSPAAAAFEDWLRAERDAEGARVDAAQAGRAALRRRGGRAEPPEG